MATCTDSGSKQTVVTSLIVNGLLFLVFIIIFIFIRSRNKLVYDKRTYSTAVTSADRPLPLNRGPIGWIIDLLKRTDAEILRDAGLDGYLFLRYLRFLFYIALFGIVLLMPILLPVNATNGNGCKGFDLLAFGNITNKNRYYAHVFLSWIFFGVTIFCIYRELLFYIGLRQAVLTSESQKYLLSNRTVLINDIPEEFLNEEYLTSIFSGVKHLFVSRDAKELQDLVAKREKFASKLEGTENSMIKDALKKRLKAEKKGKVDPQGPADINDYLKKPPTHRLGLFGGKFPFFGKKVETIPYLREQIPEVNQEIEKLRGSYSQNSKRASAFVVFHTQYDAEVAAQMLSFHRPLQMSRRTIGVHPDDVIWPNLSLRWYKTLPFALLAGTFCTLLCIFWAIPVAFVGFISQIEHLIQLFSWLSFLHKLPKVLYGLISSFLPIILLAVLMMLLPIMIRKAAKIAGAPTQVHVEYYTQNVYFLFQVVQVFFVMSLSSSIISALKQIMNDPSSILSLLQTNLPQASNIFIAYLLLQALTVPSGMLLQIVAVIFYYVFSALLDNTPRKIWGRRNSIGGPGWGTVYPVYSNMAVIMLFYSIIAPLILPFAAALFLFGYVAFLNNLLYCTAKTNTRGINFSRGLQHLFVGIYIAEVVLVILFVFSKAWGPVVLEVIMLLVTIWIHVHLQDAFDPMLFALPKSLLDHGDEKQRVSQPEFNFSTKNESAYEKGSLNGSNPFTVQSNDHYGTREPQVVHNSYDTRDAYGNQERIVDSHNLGNDAESRLVGSHDESKPKPTGKFFDRLFRPYIYYTPEVIRREMLVDQNWDEVPPVPDATTEAQAFNDPSMNTPNPTVWFPQDSYGWADEQRTELNKVGIDAHTSGSWYEVNEKKKKAKIAVTDNAEECPLYAPATSM